MKCLLLVLVCLMMVGCLSGLSRSRVPEPEPRSWWSFGEPKQENKPKSPVATVNWILCLCSALAFLLCFGSLVAAYLTQSWKFFGGLSAVLCGIAVLALTLATVLHLMVYLLIGVMVIAAAVMLIKHRDFSIVEYIKKKKEKKDATSDS